MLIPDFVVNPPNVDRYCGSSLNCLAMGQTTQESVRSGQSPFNIYVNFDQKDPKTQEENFGFSLDYLQLPC